MSASKGLGCAWHTLRRCSIELLRCSDESGLFGLRIVLYGDCGERLADLEALVTLIDIASLVILDLALIAGGVVLSIRLVVFLDRHLPMEADDER